MRSSGRVVPPLAAQRSPTDESLSCLLTNRCVSIWILHQHYVICPKDNYIQAPTHITASANATGFDAQCCYMSTHAVTVILVTERAINLQFTVAMTQSDRRMLDTVEHIRLDHSIMNHVFEYNPFAHMQGMVELPTTHIIPAQATIPTCKAWSNFQLPI